MTFKLPTAGPAPVTLADAIIAALDACDTALNDPTGDGEGTDAIAPQGEHYDAVQQIVRSVVSDWRGPQAASPAALLRILDANPRLENRLVDAAYPDGLSDALRMALSDLRAAQQANPHPAA